MEYDKKGDEDGDGGHKDEMIINVDFDSNDEDQFGQIDASQQFGQPPLYSARPAP